MSAPVTRATAWSARSEDAQRVPSAAWRKGSLAATAGPDMKMTIVVAAGVSQTNLKGVLPLCFFPTPPCCTAMQLMERFLCNECHTWTSLIVGGAV